MTRRQEANGKINSDRRKHFVSMVARALASGRPTYFQFEASCRHALRVRFILEGWCWADADAMAADIVAIGLRRIGAQRPTWLQGQREYTVAVEQCNWCQGEIDPAEIGRRRFCSTDCAKAALRYRDYDGAYINDERGAQAYYVIKLAEVERRPCAQCGVPFASADRKARFCSVACHGAAVRVIPDRQCENPGCGNTFRPRASSIKYCCHACSIEGRAVILPIRPCAQCGESFQPKHETSLYCGPKCLQRSKDARKKVARHAAVVPKICEHCQASFRPARKDQRFCSAQCQTKAASRRKAAATPVSAFFCEAAE